MSQRGTASRSRTQNCSPTVIFRHPKDSAALSVIHIAALPRLVGRGVISADGASTISILRGEGSTSVRVDDRASLAMRSADLLRSASF